MHALARRLWTIALALLVAACVSGPAAPSSGTPTTSQSGPLPSTSQSAPPPTPVSTVEAGLGDWNRLPDPTAFANASVRNVAGVADGFIATGCTTLPGDLACDQPAVWRAADAVAWSEPIRMPMAAGETAGLAKAAVAVSAGLVVGGEVRLADDRIHAALWFAPDGRSFERVPDDPALEDATIVALTAVGERVIAIGAGAYTEFAGFRAWSSEDGRTWADATPAVKGEPFPLGVLAHTDGLVAWGPICSVCPPGTAWWTSSDGVTWTEMAIDLGNRFANVTVVAEIPGGLVAFGTTGAFDDPVAPAGWLRSTGSDRWEMAVAPLGPAFDVLSQFLLVGHGSVLAGTAWSQPAYRGLVWYQAPGDPSWRQAAQMPGIEVVALLQDPVALERLIVIGRDSAGTGETVIWSGTVDWAP
jgi:hypothetical protein